MDAVKNLRMEAKYFRTEAENSSTEADVTWLDVTSLSVLLPTLSPSLDWAYSTVFFFRASFFPHASFTTNLCTLCLFLLLEKNRTKSLQLFFFFLLRLRICFLSSRDTNF